MVSTKACHSYFRMALFRETAECALSLAPNCSDIPALVTHCVGGLRKAGLNTSIVSIGCGFWIKPG